MPRQRDQLPGSPDDTIIAARRGEVVVKKSFLTPEQLKALPERAEVGKGPIDPVSGLESHFEGGADSEGNPGVGDSTGGGAGGPGSDGNAGASPGDAGGGVDGVPDQPPGPVNMIETPENLDDPFGLQAAPEPAPDTSPSGPGLGPSGVIGHGGGISGPVSEGGGIGAPGVGQPQGAATPAPPSQQAIDTGIAAVPDPVDPVLDDLTEPAPAPATPAVDLGPLSAPPQAPAVSPANSPQAKGAIAQASASIGQAVEDASTGNLSTQGMVSATEAALSQLDAELSEQGMTPEQIDAVMQDVAEGALGNLNDPAPGPQSLDEQDEINLGNQPGQSTLDQARGAFE